jgi:hypothetical protein
VGDGTDPYVAHLIEQMAGILDGGRSLLRGASHTANLPWRCPVVPGNDLVPAGDEFGGGPSADKATRAGHEDPAYANCDPIRRRSPLPLPGHAVRDWDTASTLAFYVTVNITCRCYLARMPHDVIAEHLSHPRPGLYCRRGATA